VEIKNLNSFKFVRDAIQIEADRQIACLGAGESIRHHTRHYDEDTRRTHAMRDKESAADYRFMPEPDLPTLTLTQSMIDEIAESLPELPMARRRRYMRELGLAAPDVRTIVDDPARMTYFEEALGALAHADAAAMLASWVVQQWPGLSHRLMTPERAAALIDALAHHVILHGAARQLLEIMSHDPRPVPELIVAHELELQSDPSKIRSILEEILASNDQQLADYRAGKTALFGFFMGKAMGMTRGNVDPALVKTLLHQMLGDPWS
jgi:aspartyl-tRNA(Asn)/glutamyl-tRNA(Gln) amidotransferase subunit B